MPKSEKDKKKKSRLSIIAREVRDIPTALGTVIKVKKISNKKSNTIAKNDLKRQVRQVGNAITKGKSGTSAAKAVPTGKRRMSDGYSLAVQKTQMGKKRK
jgi:hypothetical protein